MKYAIKVHRIERNEAGEEVATEIQEEVEVDTEARGWERPDRVLARLAKKADLSVYRLEYDAAMLPEATRASVERILAEQQTIGDRKRARDEA